MSPISAAAAAAAATSPQPLHHWLTWLCILASVLVSNVVGVIGVENPLTPKAYALSYWEKHVTGGLPKSEILMDKASPLTAAQYATFNKIADDQNTLSAHMPELCSQANLMCFPNSADSDIEKTLDQRRRCFSYQFYYRFSRRSCRFKKGLGENEKVTNWLPPGMFFREATLKPGVLITMPDFIDKNPARSFLPRTIVSKLPFASSKLADIKKIFHAGDHPSRTQMFTDALDDCEREPNVGETKRCVASIEDMVDFATLVLGQKAVPRTMESKAGSNTTALLGDVKPINGGRLTKSVSCHQRLYPYLLYYCHSVNGIRLYEADILDPKTKSKINHAVAICHEDTSSWSADHSAFAELGSSPGKIEVCHWIFENDLMWVIAD